MDKDVRFTRALMSMTDAARHLGVPQQTFHRWARGYPRGGPLLHISATDNIRQASVPFIALAEAWVLEGLRQAGVRPQRIRPALEKLQREFGREYVLVSPALVTDGISVLWDFSKTEAGAGLIEGRSGQTVIREIVQDYLTYVGFGSDNLPNHLKLKVFEPSAVAIDPYRSSGQPVFVGSGARVSNVAAMLRAGEEPAIVAEEHGIGIEAVRAAARVLLGRAA
ncbi:hypothetical protein BS329_03235 [Amycolatopsis coloradensis]|uniref:Putative antitoxin VapB45-like DNA-binding HTH domain-containing protein n=1 Tax=Amycolatopsis coloradensis TaxID=76021 RepID=A0A1R0L2R1_9PSEU|nr:DUF433 domain-containing protein [Amycolatopsis coloradensis]OLZ56645.1 hypothetical protein BS329_03235 [Amycolatopsis coloradensis]